jgi:hypothetical protein
MSRAPSRITLRSSSLCFRRRDIALMIVNCVQYDELRSLSQDTLRFGRETELLSYRPKVFTTYYKEKNLMNMGRLKRKSARWVGWW